MRALWALYAYLTIMLTMYWTSSILLMKKSSKVLMPQRHLRHYYFDGLIAVMRVNTQSTFTCSNSTIKPPETFVKPVQS